MKLCLMILSVPWYMFNGPENAIVSPFLTFITGSSSRVSTMQTPIIILINYALLSNFIINHALLSNFIINYARLPNFIINHALLSNFINRASFIIKLGNRA
jgi:hypothetical protein